MKKIVFLMILLGFFFDYSFLSSFAPAFSGVNLVLVSLVIVCLERDFFEAAGWAVLSGLMLDYVSHTPLGVNIFLFIWIVWLFDFFRRKLLPSKVTTSLVFVSFLGSFLLYEISKFSLLKLLDFFDIYNFEVRAPGEHFYVLAMAKFAIALLGLLFFKLYTMARKIWGSGKLEIKI